MHASRIYFRAMLVPITPPPPPTSSPCSGNKPHNFDKTDIAFFCCLKFFFFFQKKRIQKFMFRNDFNPHMGAACVLLEQSMTMEKQIYIHAM